MTAGNDNAPLITPTPRRGLAWLLLDFSGRVDRELYWYALAFVWTAVLAAAAFAAARGGEGDIGLTVATVILSVAPLWPEMALMSKRLHDLGLPGFLCVLDLVPVLGTALTVLLGLLPGRRGANRYGPSPIDGNGREKPNA